MKYISIDIETTGLSPENNQTIEFGAIIEDTNNPLPFDQIPKFKRAVMNKEYTGSAFAINMNARVFSNIVDKNYTEKCWNYQLADKFAKFLKQNGYGPDSEEDPRIKFMAAGKNYATFDRMFLRKIPKWTTMFIEGHRCIDPAILYIDWQQDNDIPGLQLCKDRAKVEGIVTHDALEDAWDVIQVLRPFYTLDKEILKNVS